MFAPGYGSYFGLRQRPFDRHSAGLAQHILTGAWESHGGSIAGSPEGRKHDVAALVLDARRKEIIEKAIAVLRAFIVSKSNGLDVYMVGVRDLRQLISRWDGCDSASRKVFEVASNRCLGDGCMIPA